MFVKAAVIAAVAALSSVGAAHAQNFLSMDLNQMNQSFAMSQNNMMAARTQQMVQSNLNNPQVMAGYSTGLCGAGLTPQQYAYKYAATGGCSAQGYANYNSTTTQIGQDNRNNMAAYFQSQQNYRDAYNAYTGGFAANTTEAGRLMGGNQTYYDQTTGRNLALGYIPPGQTYYDASTNRRYAMGQNGQYYSIDSNGYATMINPASRSPR